MRNFELDIPDNPHYSSTFYNDYDKEMLMLTHSLGSDESIVSEYHAGAFSMFVKFVGYTEPNLIRLRGWYAKTQICTVCVNVNAVSIVTRIVKKTSKNEKRVIGFIGEAPMPG